MSLTVFTYKKAGIKVGKVLAYLFLSLYISLRFLY
jgi:hypothetical protein